MPNPNQFTLSDLISADTPQSVLQFMLTELANAGLPVTNWPEGNVFTTLLSAESISLSSMSNIISFLAQQTLLGLVQGQYLTLLAQDLFQLNRFLPKIAIVSGSAYINPGNPSKTINAAGLTIMTPSGFLYTSNNTGSVLIPNNSTRIGFQFVAQNPGTAYNIINANTQFIPVTSVPGLFVQPSSNNGTPFIQLGYDGETDAQLTSRCQNQWGLQSINSTIAKYEYIAQNSNTQTIPTRVNVDDTNPNGPGTMNIWVFGSNGGLSTSDLAIIQNNVNLSGSICEAVTVQNAIAYNTTIAGQIYILTANNNLSTQQQIQNNINNIISNTPIFGIIYYSQINNAIQEVLGVRNVDLLTINGISEDIPMNVNAAPVLQPLALNFISV